jgi:hypothetical protein
LLTLYLTAARWSDAFGAHHGVDLSVFLEAARHAARGESVYSAPAYVYSPLIAWLLVPFHSLHDATVFVTGASLASCLLAVAAVTITLWPRLRPWHRPVVAGAAVVTLFYNNGLVLHLWLGQVDTIVLAACAVAVLGAAIRAPALSGVMLGVTAIIKTWPVGSWLWLLRRGAERRVLAAVSALICCGLIVLAMLVIGGPTLIVDWVERTVAFSQQQLLAYSVWGVGRFLFSDNAVMDPLLIAPLLGGVVSSVLAVGLVVLIVVALRRPGSDSLAMWNVLGAVVMLLPVSHLWYRLLMLPLLWVWLACTLRRPSVAKVITLVLCALFWAVTFRLQPLDNIHTSGWLQYIAVMVVGIAALTMSVVVASRLDRRPDVGRVAASL